MNASQALFTAAAEACDKIDAEEAAAERGAADIAALMVVRGQTLQAFGASFLSTMTALVDTAYAGDAFAAAWVAAAFGDLAFDPDGEEFGHGRTLPADKTQVLTRVAAVEPQKARSILRDLAEQA